MLFILSFIITAWGIALIGLGRRGRRLDDHPICRKCRFDLVGSLPPGRRSAFGVPKKARCPECGVALARAGAIEIGNRARRPGVIRAGVVVTAAGVLGLLLMMYAGLSAAGLARHQPTWMLMWRAGEDQAALRELETRISSGKCSAAQVGRAVDQALCVQGDLSREWDRAWGEIVEVARARGVVDAQRWGRYIRQGYGAAKMHIEVDRGEGRPGDTAELRVRLGGELRYGDAGRVRPPMFMVIARLEGATVDGGGEIVLEQNNQSRLILPPFAPLCPVPEGWVEVPGPSYSGGGWLGAWGGMRFDAPTRTVRAKWSFRGLNPDGSVAAGWEREFEAEIGR